MSKERNNIVGIDLEELLNLIKVSVRDEIETCLQDCRFGTEFKDETWNREQVADFFHVSPEKISDRFKKNEIPGIKIGHEYFFLKSHIIGLFKKLKK